MVGAARGMRITFTFGLDLSHPRLLRSRVSLMFKQLRLRMPVEGAAGLHRAFAILMGFGFVQMLSGCISTERPGLAVDIPPAYRAARGVPLGPPPALDWWRGFQSKELTDLIEQAQAANYDIAAAIARIEQADAASKIAGAPLLPLVNFNSSGTKSRSSQAGGSSTISGGGSGSERSVYSMALNASYQIDFWGLNRANSRAAQENAISTRFARDVVTLSTMVSVATAYFQVLSSQDRLKTARQNLAAAQRVLNLIMQRFNAGTASQLDVAQQESLVASQRTAIPPLDQALRQNMSALAVLVGRAPAYLTVRGGSLYRLGLPRVTPGLPSDLLLQRPDIRAAEASLASADASVEAARAAFFPTISLTSQYGITSTALKTLFTPEAIFYSLAASAAQPVFDGFRLEGLFEQSRGRQNELLADYRKTVVQSFADVENALIAIQDTAERERLQRDVVMASRRAFEIAETRLREGTVDLVIVLQTQQTLFQAEDTLAQARLARMQAVLSLYQALGGSWFPPTTDKPAKAKHIRGKPARDKTARR
jgi:multidrug efflux system outer membrane protein